MPVRILNIDHSRDWPELGSLLFDTQKDPYQSYFRGLYLDLNDQARDIQRNTCQQIERVKINCSNDPTSYAIKAVDVETGLILGCSLWNIRTTTKPSTVWNGPRCDFEMYVEDDETELISDAIEQLEIARAGPTHLPHIFLYTIATRSDTVVGEVRQLLLSSGLEKADSLGFETWSFTSSPTASLYSAAGFDVLGRLGVRSRDSPSQDPGLGLARSFQPFTTWSIYREPKNNRVKYQEHYSNTDGFW